MSNLLQMASEPREVRGAPARAPQLVAVGGLDPTGGAGIVRDYLTARALGAEARLVTSALTEQSTHRGVFAVEPRDPPSLARSLRAALELMSEAAGPERRLGAVKIGMVPGRAQAEVIIDTLRDFAGPVIVDPVLASSSGGRLLVDDPQALRPLLMRATLVTPNAVEAARLAGRPVASVLDAVDAGRRLIAEGMRAVLVKGGHLSEGSATDVLLRSDHPPGDGSSGAAPLDVRFDEPRLPVGKVRGTGCALATAIAVHLARGDDLVEAIRRAKAWLTVALGSTIAIGDERHFAP